MCEDAFTPSHNNPKQTTPTSKETTLLSPSGVVSPSRSCSLCSAAEAKWCFDVFEGMKEKKRNTKRGISTLRGEVDGFRGLRAETCQGRRQLLLRYADCASP